jgi:hypothetical protein
VRRPAAGTLLGVLLIPLSVPASLFGQAPPGSDLTVTLLTYETGGLVWERFGHNAIVIRDATTGTVKHYDYGRFSFGQGLRAKAMFFLNFARGKMWYSMGSDDDPDRYIALYASEGRKIWAQELEVPPAKRAALRDFLEWNDRPENAGYAYDYYRDNCSTRIRDALDHALGGAIRRYAMAPSGFSWREETRRLDQHDPLLYTGLMLGLGQPVDVEMSRWDQMFLPIRLREHLDSISVIGADGVARPAVKAERVLSEGGRWPVPVRPSDWTARYLALGVLFGGMLAGLGRLAKRGGRAARATYLVVSVLWSLTAGVSGVVLTWLGVFSGHVAAHQNENLFLFNLFSAALAVVLPAALWGKPWAGKPARRLALGVVAVAALGLVLKLLPTFDQRNMELIGLALPVHLALWLSLRAPGPS